MEEFRLSDSDHESMDADTVGDNDHEQVKTADYELVSEGKIEKIPTYSIDKIILQEEDKYEVLYLKRLMPFMKFARTDQIFKFDRASINLNIEPPSFTGSTM